MFKIPFKILVKDVYNPGYWFDQNGNCIRLTTECHGSDLYLKHSLFGITREQLKDHCYGTGSFRRISGIRYADYEYNLISIAYDHGWSRLRVYKQSDNHVNLSITTKLKPLQIKHILRRLNIVQLMIDRGFKCIDDININDGNSHGIYDEISKLTIDDVL